MLRVTKVSKSYGGQTVLDDISFILSRGERAGLIGRNGCGKTTLLRIITRLENADSGQVSIDPSATIGYLPQGLAALEGQTVAGYIRSGIAGFDDTRAEMEALARMMERDPSPLVVERYGRAVARFEGLGGYTVESRIEGVLAGLGLGNVEPEAVLDKLSGGQRTRVGLARLLVAEPNLLILDEPTNHLDIAALEWLEGFVRDYRGAALIVSHDWAFLDATVTRILELDDQTHHLAEYAGNYSDYVATKARQVEKQWVEWQDQQDEIARLRSAATHLRGIAKFRKGGKADSGDKFAKGFFANRGLETMRRAKRIEDRLEHLMTDEKVAKPAQSYRMKLEFEETPRSGQIVVRLDDLGQAFGERWIFRHADLTLVHGERIALVGANGSGKTTLLRNLTGEIQPSEGSVHLGANVRIGYMSQEQETLNPKSTPLELVRELKAMDETAARHFLHLFLFQGDEVFTQVEKLSYGERARLLLARLVIGGANCLLLDEPINHLDIPSRERFEQALEAFPGTLLIAVHDRAFIDRFSSGIWALEEGRLRKYIDREEMQTRRGN